jgi:hypothetical protein
MTPPERRPPTHILTIEVPLALDVDLVGREVQDFDPLREALSIVLALSRLAVAGALCDDPTVSVRDAT